MLNLHPELFKDILSDVSCEIVKGVQFSILRANVALDLDQRDQLSSEIGKFVSSKLKDVFEPFIQ